MLRNAYSFTKVGMDATNAGNTAEQRHKDGKKGGKQDAFRHTYWQALNTQDAGEKYARDFSDSHEYPTPSNETNDILMDIHNNDVGIEIGKNNPNASPEELQKIIDDKMKNGDLIIMDKNGNLTKSNGEPVDNSKTRRSEKAKEISIDIKNNRINNGYEDY